MKPLNNWNETPAKTINVINDVKLTDGGHGCIMLKPGEIITNNYGKQMMQVAIDIKENSEFDGYYLKKLEQKRKFSPTAAYQGYYRVALEDKNGNTNPYFKGFITAVEESNPGYKWNWDEKTLKGKKIGIVFRMEEYSYNGYDGEAARPFYACAYDDAPNMPIPKPKKLQKVENPVVDMTPAEEEEVPF